MNRADRIRACYDHACIKRVNREYMTNASLRERLNVEERNISMISRLLKETTSIGLIKISDISTGAKFRKYLPYWA
jgi:predicted HTH transcriptional regulator